MIEFLMSKNVTYLELFYIILGVVLSKVYLALVAVSTINLTHKKKGSTVLSFFAVFISFNHFFLWCGHWELLKVLSCYPA